MQISVFCSDSVDERISALVQVLQQLGHPASIVADWRDAGAKQSRTRDSRLIIVPDTSEDAKLAEDAVSYLAAVQDRSFLVYIANTIAPDVYKRLMRTERGEWISWQAIRDELADLIAKVDHSTTEGAAATIVSFLPSAGGVGNTTLAVETGFCLAAGKKKDSARVAVIDLNFQASTLADLLDLEPRLDVSELVERPERLDDRLIDVFTSHHSEHLDVFSSPTRFDGPEAVNSKVVFSLLDGISKRYDFILVDLPHHWSPWVDNVLQGSDAIIVTGGSTVPTIKQLTKRVQHLESLTIPPERTQVVVNQCQVTFLGTIPRKPHIERVLSGGSPIYVRQDTAIAGQAANTGRPMMEIAPRHSVCKSIRQIAQWVRTVDNRSGAPSK